MGHHSDISAHATTWCHLSVARRPMSTRGRPRMSIDKLGYEGERKRRQRAYELSQIVFWRLLTLYPARTSAKIMLLQRYRSHGVIRMMNRESHHRAMRKGMRLWFRLG